VNLHTQSLLQGLKRNASNTPSNTHFSTHPFWLVKIHMGPTKLIWDPHDLVGPMWILTNQRECVEKCVLEGVLLAFLLKSNILFVIFCIIFFREFITLILFHKGIYLLIYCNFIMASNQQHSFLFWPNSSFLSFILCIVAIFIEWIKRK